MGALRCTAAHWYGVNASAKVALQLQTYVIKLHEDTEHGVTILPGTCIVQNISNDPAEQYCQWKNFCVSYKQVKVVRLSSFI